MGKSLALVCGIALFGITASAVAGGAGCTAVSGPQRTALLELYTSEGCSSCPPADAALRALEKRADVPGRVVPLSLHVDYWNRLGWRDRFSDPAYTRRQRVLGRRDGLRTIYTPQFAFNGHSLGSRLDGRLDQALAAMSSRPEADIRLRIGTLADSGLPLDVDAHSKLPGARLYVAVYESGLSSQVTRGENRGRLLEHDYVVRTLVGPIAPRPDGRITWRGRLAVPAELAASHTGVAAFVQHVASGDVLQAVARPLCGASSTGS